MQYSCAGQPLSDAVLRCSGLHSRCLVLLYSQGSSPYYLLNTSTISDHSNSTSKSQSVITRLKSSYLSDPSADTLIRLCNTSSLFITTVTFKRSSLYIYLYSVCFLSKTTSFSFEMQCPSRLSSIPAFRDLHFFVFDIFPSFPFFLFIPHLSKL
ncbi:hypothetical protein AB6A40_005332 [Gnathostoma spinigerum]|uniref:Uncharacterized protein n=1 Tax=Gnathostoma spinigerum TaxID=75299 RepID=A0ABD6EF53_9BILA